MAKKKSNPQSENSKTQHHLPDHAASDKLDSLKSLNAMLLKETVERRQQVDSLTQINESLESELNRCNSDKVSLESELNGLTERAVMSEIEKGLVSMFVAVQVNEMAEFNRRDMVAMKEKVGGLERDMERLLEEKKAIERENNKKESEIGSLNNRLNTFITEIGEERSVSSKVRQERDEIRAHLDERIEHENGLISKLAEAEKRETTVSEKSQKFKVNCDRLVEEKIVLERKMDSIMREKDLVERSLVASNGLVDEMKRDFEKIVREKRATEHQRNVEEGKKTELQNLVDKLEKGGDHLVKKIADLEKKCVMYSEKEAGMSMEIGVLVKETQEFQESIQKLMKKQQKAETNLSNEKLKVKNLNEKISKMEKGMEEHEDTKAKLSRTEGDIARILEILKNTSLICNSKEDDDIIINQDCKFGEEIKHHVAEVEAIKKAFKDKQGIVQEVKKQVETLKVCVAKADKGKSFWTMVSSATTILAAVSLAYVARGSY